MHIPTVKGLEMLAFTLYCLPPLGVMCNNDQIHLWHRLTFPEQRQSQKRKLGDRDEADKNGEAKEDDVLIVEPYTIPNRGPYPYNQPKK